MNRAFPVRLIATIAWGAFLATSSCPARAAEEPGGCGVKGAAAEARQPSAAAWIVSTRHAPSGCPAGFDPDRFSYRRRDAIHTGWTAATAEAFFEPALAEVPLVVFVHGNRADLCTAVNQGLPIFHRLRRVSADQPFRLVIWAWPADRTAGGPRRDALVKAARSDVQSYYLAAWLDRLPAESPVLLIGYSFGARVIAGALHLAEGGQLNGWQLQRDGPEAERRPARVMLIAAALDSEWLLPGSRHGLALHGIDQLMITGNCLDPVLRLYPRMRRDDRSTALGFAGPACPRRLSDAGLCFERVRVECQVGRAHDWRAYLDSPAVDSRLARYAFPVGGAEP
ncbi:MAG: hypothetical protein PHO07_20735 [Pirellulales bacterium]|jgi:hypothetical protein|nr:hypothetical protein [Thermoguttaceae bacterium]MDD4789603.1 hypothetical protein [Pirellulales bacterium]MDI9444448.1 hypothetical protein [Planctomycetota bacterium]NLZ00471.1 hypothetical protein [Pirellulaceae bacterium]